MHRRQMLSLALASSLAAAGRRLAAMSPAGRLPRILVRSSWQTVNIGDIAHTPGLLSLLERHVPEAELYLWPSNLDNGVDQLLSRRFPRVRILKTPREIEGAIERCDFLLHSSGASLVAERDVGRWWNQTGKPFGIYGITLPPKRSSSTTATSNAAMAKTIELLSQADFVFFRDSHSLALAKEKGCTCPVMEFGPDAAFACDLRDDEKAEDFLQQHGLEVGRYMCCIPRLRYTPYWTIESKNQAFDPVKHARNEAMKEHDHAQLREAIVRITQETELKVLLCPEDQTQMEVGREMLLEKLPRAVRDRVVWRPNYWLTGEAISTYIRSVGLFGNEMHSPIMCIGHGVPAVVCRFAEQTSKGFMWEDIGLEDWLFDLDDEQQVAQIVPTILSVATDQAAARRKAADAKRFVQRRQRETMMVLANSL